MKSRDSEQKKQNFLQKISQQLEIKKKLKVVKLDAGEGGFSHVMIVQNELKKQYAIKIISVFDEIDDVCEIKLQAAKKEAEILSRCSHPHIVKYNDEFALGFNYFILMEKCEMSLTELVDQGTKVEKNKFIEYAIQILSAVSYLHQNGFVLRDLTLNNILLDSNGKIKLCDFGLVKEFDPVLSAEAFLTSQIQGIYNYLPPEVIRIIDHSRNRKIYRTIEGDIWALGGCLYILAGATPQDLCSISKRQQSYQKKHYLGDEINYIIEGILKIDPKERPKIEKIIQQFNELKSNQSLKFQNNINQMEDKLFSNLTMSTSGHMLDKKNSFNNSYLKVHPNSTDKNTIQSIEKTDVFEKKKCGQAIQYYKNAIYKQLNLDDCQKSYENIEIDKKMLNDAILCFSTQLEINTSNGCSQFGSGSSGDFTSSKKAEDLIFSCYLEGLQINPNVNESQTDNQLNEISWKKKIFDETVSQYKKAVELNPQNEQALNGLGNLYRKNEMLDEAINYYQKALFVNKNNDSTHIGLGQVYHDKKMHDKAIQSFKKALVINPKNEYAHNGLGYIYYDKKMFDPAIESYQKALEINPNFLGANNNLGNIYSDKKELEKAIKFYQRAIQINPKYGIAYYNLGNVYGDKKRYEEAISNFKRALEINPNNEYAYNGLGVVYDDMKEFDEAIKCFERAILINSQFEIAHNNLGTVYETKNMLKEALKCFEKALQIKPHYEYAHNGKGNIYFYQKKFREAIECYKQALQINPNNAQAHNGLGNVYLDSEMFDEAILCYKQAIQIKSDYDIAHQNLGTVYENKKMYNEAFVCYKTALKIDSNNNEDTYNGLGNIYYQIKQFDKAISHYNRALQINPHHEIARENLTNILQNKEFQESSTRSNHNAKQKSFNKETDNSNDFKNTSKRQNIFDQEISFSGTSCFYSSSDD